MPTGYTNKIGEGQSFEDFILGCARAFGALVTMRDDSQDTPIPEKFEASEYHLREAAAAAIELEKLKEMPFEEAEKRAKEKYESELMSIENSINSARELEATYKQMLSQVMAWKAPTADHMELKKFMVQQIEESIKFDCDTGYYLGKDIKLLTGEQWRTGEIKQAFEGIDYHKKEQAKEVERIARRNDWITRLRESLS